MPSDAALILKGRHAHRRRLPRLAIRDRISDWIFPPKGPETPPVKLSQRRVYILPNNAGLLYGVTLVLMLIGSINYDLSLGYGLTFLLTGTGVVSMLHTWRNIAHLELSPGKSEPVFAGDRARFSIISNNPSRVSRRSVAIQFADRQSDYFNIRPAREATLRIRLPAQHRGFFFDPVASVYIQLIRWDCSTPGQTSNST